MPVTLRTKWRRLRIAPFGSPTHFKQHARLKGLRNNLCAATRLGLRFNNLSSGLTTIQYHTPTEVRQWVKQSSVTGITALKCGRRHHIPAAYQIDLCVRLSNVMCHLMICILTTSMRWEPWQTFLDCFQSVDIPRSGLL